MNYHLLIQILLAGLVMTQLILLRDPTNAIKVSIGTAWRNSYQHDVETVIKVSTFMGKYWYIFNAACTIAVACLLYWVIIKYDLINAFMVLTLLCNAQILTAASLETYMHTRIRVKLWSILAVISFMATIYASL